MRGNTVSVDRVIPAPPAKIFDLEFAFAGPVGFDLGAFFGNVLLAQARAAVLDRPAEFQEWLASLVAGRPGAAAGSRWRARGSARPRPAWRRSRRARCPSRWWRDGPCCSA